MSAFSFQTVPSLKFGEPAAEALAPMIGSFGAQRLMIVTDPGVVAAVWLTRFLRLWRGLA